MPTLLPMLGLLLPAALAAGDPPDLTGTWRVELEVATEARVPVLGTTVVLTRQTMVATVRRTADGFVQTHDTCALAARSTRALAEPYLPPSFVDAVPNKTYPLVLTEEGGRWRVRGDFQPLYVGYDPKTTNGEVPEAADGPGVTDWEGDGKPGATIHLLVPVFGKVEVYQAQRGRTMIDGWVESADLLTGGATVEWFRQRTLDASNRLFAANPDIRPSGTGSWFRQERVADGTTCATLAG